VRARSRPIGPFAWATDFVDARRPSFAVSGVGDLLILTGIAAAACGLAGFGDDNGDASWLCGSGATMVAIGVQIRRRFVRPRRTAPARILRGLGIIWVGACLTGAVIYLVTGTVDRVDDALLESTAGFTTTNVTTLDPTELSRGIVLWRSATQWIAGYLAILLSVVAIPEALKGTALQARGDEGGHHLVADAMTGRRRILSLYSGFTALLLVGYLLTGLGAVDAIAHGLSTASTGGFSTNADSFSGYGSGPRVVATVGMFVAGSSIFVLWWLVRGQLQPIWRATELRAYAAMIAGATALIVVDVEGIGVGDALFTATSVASTTGFAIGDWAAWSDDAEGVLLIIAAIGSMLGSAGGGFKVVRAQLLFKYAVRSMRQELDPRAVIVVKHRGHALDERSLHRLAGFQISHLMICGAAALAMASFGMSVLGSVWGATSAVSTLGPAVGEIGSFGSVDGLTAGARAVLIPAMLAGRLSIVPALVVVVWALRSERRLGLRVRRVLTAVGRRAGQARSVG
jgi:trk system potassium uptake protein TrkH